MLALFASWIYFSSQASNSKAFKRCSSKIGRRKVSSQVSLRSFGIFSGEVARQDFRQGFGVGRFQQGISGEILALHFSGEVL